MKYLMAFIYAAAPAIVLGLIGAVFFDNLGSGLVWGIIAFILLLNLLLTSKKDDDDDYPCF